MGDAKKLFKETFSYLITDQTNKKNHKERKLDGINDKQLTGGIKLHHELF